MNLFHVPLFVRANTPEDLVAAMIQNNSDNSITYKYFNIVFDGKTYTAWYHGDATRLVKQTFAKPSKEVPNVRTKKSSP